MWLRGRSKDMLITAGFNIYPSDIEAVLSKHQDVSDVAAIGIPEAVLGEIPVAFVVLRKSVKYSSNVERHLCTWANGRLNSNQRLYKVKIIDSLPYNSNGKVDKNRLFELTQTQHSST